MADSEESGTERQEAQVEEAGEPVAEVGSGAALPGESEATPAVPGSSSHKQFPGELSAPFEEVWEGVRKRSSLPFRVLGLVLQPLLGSLSHSAQLQVEITVGHPGFYSVTMATGLNLVFNLFFYTVLLMAVAVNQHGPGILFDQGINGFILLGFFLGFMEGLYRLKGGVFHTRPPEEMTFKSSLYGFPLSGLVRAVMTGRIRLMRGLPVPVEGFYAKDFFVEKLERERRYGQAYTIEDLGRAYHLRLQFPRKVPDIGLAAQSGIPDEMPDYDYDLLLENGHFIIKGRCQDERVRRIAGNAGAFPAEFTTVIPLQERVAGFSHRYRDKLLDILLLKEDGLHRPL